MTQENDSNDRFEYLLERRINETITDEECDDYFDYFDNPDESARFSFLKRAAERGDRCSYYPLGRAFLFGKGCDKSFEKAVFWLEKSIENKEDGAGLLGDCYRLGIEVRKDYESAWKYYKKVDYVRATYDQETLDDKYIGNVTLGDLTIGMLDNSLPVEWWEFVMTKIEDSASFFADMSWLYKQDTDRWLYWRTKAAEAGDIGSMEDMLERLTSQAERNEYVERIIELAPDYDPVFHYLGIKIIMGDYPLEIKTKAVQKFELYDNECQDTELFETFYTLLDGC